MLGLPGQQLVGHALERLADHDRLAAVGVARAEVDVGQRPGAPPVAPLRAEHHQVEGVHRLDLLPRLAPPPRRVRGVERLDDHALVPAPQRVVEHAGGLLGRRATDARHPQRRVRGQQAGQRVEPGWSGSSMRSVPSRCRRSKKNGGEHRVLRRRRRCRSGSSCPGTGGAAVVVEREGLAVEHEGAAGKRAHLRDHLGHARGDLARLRVQTRTSSPSRWTWMRAPSSLYSTVTSAPSAANAVSSESPGEASIGRTGLPTCRVTASSAAAPPRARGGRSRGGARTA